MANPSMAPVKVTVVGAGGAGGNAIARMARSGIQGVDLLALNTDVQALSQVKRVRTFAIGPETTRGMGSGGRPETGRKAMKESQEQVSQLLEGSDMVFVASGMGGGTGTGAAPIIADIARRQGALTVGVVTLPFSFEGSQRRETADQGLRLLREKVDTLIAVENDRLLPALNGDVRLDKAFELADEVLRQGVQGIADLVTVPGMINVDFADVKAVMRNGGPTYMAVGEGRGKSATTQAAQFALSNPLFDAPLRGASGILFNITGGKDLTLGQVHEVADLIREASDSDANVVFGVVQDKRLKGRVSLTLVATGVRQGPGPETDPDGEDDEVGDAGPGLLETVARVASNGHHVDDPKLTTRLF